MIRKDDDGGRPHVDMRTRAADCRIREGLVHIWKEESIGAGNLNAAPRGAPSTFLIQPLAEWFLATSTRCDGTGDAVQR